jgi:predicted DNA-binding transcriptional regulator YafY
MIRGHNGLMRADRLLSILLILQTQGQATSRELARRLEVSERTVHRDMEALTAAGVPVYAERGSRGGWRLLEEYRTQLTGLTESEILALFALKPPHLLADLGLGRAAENALLKLLAALPAPRRKGAEYARERLLVDGSGREEPVPWLPLLQAAVWEERRVRLHYPSGGGPPAERLVDPLGLVVRGQAWYLVARRGDDLRTYRVSRIAHAELLLERFSRPPGFDLERHWRQARSEFQASLPVYPVQARVEQRAFERFGLVGRWARLEHAEPEGEGWLRAHIRFEVEEDALAWALSLSGRVEVLEPAALRQKVREELLKALQQANGEPPSR